MCCRNLNESVAVVPHRDPFMPDAFASGMERDQIKFWWNESIVM